jgi:hypothetical protein
MALAVAVPLVGWRIVACVAALIVPALAGCLGSDTPAADATNGPRLAQPTTKTPEVPAFANRTLPNETPDFSDVGYILTPNWAVGDEWDYVSNQSNYRNVKVVREERVGEKRYLVVEEEGSRLGNAPRWRGVWYLDPTTNLRLNFTFTTGFDSYVYGPGKPDDFYFKNGTFAYNETKFQHGTEVLKLVIRANSFFAGYETVPLMWGKTTVGRVEHRVLKTDAEGNSFRELYVHFPVRDYGADAQYQLPSEELWRVIYVKHGDVELGEPLRY